MFSNENDVTMVAWTLGIQECGLWMTLSQLKMKQNFFKPAHPFQKWNSLELLVVLVQMITSKIKY